MKKMFLIIVMILLICLIAGLATATESDETAQAIDVINKLQHQFTQPIRNTGSSDGYGVLKLIYGTRFYRWPSF